jgi:hypothetical protein
MKVKLLANLHKKLGLASLVMVVMLVLTGLLLNHTEQLKLHDSSVANSWLNKWYGINLPKAETGINVQQTWFSLVDYQLFIDENVVPNVEITSLYGVEKTSFGWLIASSNQITLLTEQAELIDQIQLSSNVTAGYFSEQKLIIALENKLFYEINPPYENISEVLFTPSKNKQHKHHPLPLPLTEKINQQFLKQGLSLERVILDIHSGRILGDIGVYIVDFFSILFLILSMTGFWLYLKRKSPR